MNLGFSRYCRTWCLLLFLLLLTGVGQEAWAQGKIAGRVTDAGNGEALIGVNVILDGTTQGTITDTDGNYIILNVRPGRYTLVFSYIGYQTHNIEAISVTTGQTSRYDVELRDETIQGQEIVVQAERPLVQKDLTASKKTVVSEEIDALPVESFFGVLATQAGVNEGADGAIHIRGGRSNEIAYLVDGMSVSNPFNTNGLATTVAKDAIQEMTVISGAFNAEYGKAMSGIVNLVTKEGNEKTEGSVSFYGGDTITGNSDVFMTPSGVALNEYTFEGTLSGPVPVYKKVNYFMSLRRDVDDGSVFGVRMHAPSDSANFNGAVPYWELQGHPWWEYMPEDTPGLQSLISSVGVDPETTTFGRPIPNEVVALNPSSSTNFIAKLTTRPFVGTKLEYSFLLDRSEFKPMNGNTFEYRFNPDGIETQRENGFNHGLQWTHSLNDRSFYTMRVSYARNRFKRFVYENPTDPRYVKDLGGTGDGTVVGFPGNNFLFGGNQKTHLREFSRSIRAKFDLTRQFGAIHEVKTGIETQLHSLDRDNFVVLFDGNVYREPTVPPVTSPAHDNYEDQRVTEVSAYAQDKLEFDDFIINAGLRYEFFNPNGEFIPDLLNPNGPREEATAKNLLLPRVGISFPITEQGIIHLSYGHFAQMPSLRRLYLNPEFEFPKGSPPTFGNTNMRPERTVQYEIGLQQQISQTMAFDITGYFKDIRDYRAVQQVRFSTIAGEDVYNIELNRDYANVKGITFALTKRRGRGGMLAASVDYTFQIAEGNNDDADAFFFNFLSGKENEFELIPLSFDQQHILSSTVTLSQPNNWSLSFIGQFATGYPYTPLLLEQKIDQLPNSGRKPNQIKLDAHLFKELSIGGLQARAFAKVFNVLDRLNERFVFDDTGRATYSLNGQRGVHAAWEPFYGLPGIQDLDTYNTRPHWYSSPRTVQLGISFSF